LGNDQTENFYLTNMVEWCGITANGCEMKQWVGRMKTMKSGIKKILSPTHTHK